MLGSLRGCRQTRSGRAPLNVPGTRQQALFLGRWVPEYSVQAQCSAEQRAQRVQRECNGAAGVTGAAGALRAIGVLSEFSKHEHRSRYNICSPP